MSRRDETMVERGPFARFLIDELKSRPGRVAACIRITASCVVVVVLGMTFQIPLPAYMAYIVLLVSREELVSTLIISVAGLAAATLAVSLTLLLYIVDAGEPALRLPAIALSCFMAMYLVRTCTLGPIALLAGFILVLSQSLIDDFRTTESLVRFVLWLWVVVSLPAVLTAVMNMGFGARPQHLATDRLGTLLDEMADGIDGRRSADFWRAQATVLEIRELWGKAQKVDASLRGKSPIDEHALDGVSRLAALVCILPSSTEGDLRALLAGSLRHCKPVLMGRSQRPTPLLRVPPGVIAAAAPDVARVAMAMEHIITDLAGRAWERERAKPTDEPKKPSLFVADAFTNRAYARFALKTTIAVMLCYVTYTLLDWPGIRTAVTTCFFVALGSSGETLHKLSLRLSGALIGGLVAGLCLVFVVPSMTDIGQLSVLVTVVSAICAWVATSSDRLSYAGMQMAFAFFLGIFQGYGPPTDLTELRDRVVGVLLGNVAMAVVFTTLWPVSAMDLARASLGKLFEKLALGLRSPGPASPSFSGMAENLIRTRNLVGLSMFDRPLAPERARPALIRGDLINQVARMTAVAAILSDPEERTATAWPTDEKAALMEWLHGVGRGLSAHGPIPAFPGAATDQETVTQDGTKRTWTMTWLNRECEHVASLL